jgi:hypothetical protein
MLRTARLLPLEGLLTLGFDSDCFQTEPPACYRAPWRLPGPVLHRLATTSFRLSQITSSVIPPNPCAHSHSPWNFGRSKADY